MKLNFNKKYSTIAVYSALVILFAALCVYFLINISALEKLLTTIENVLLPIVYAIVIYYLLNPISVFFEKKVFAFIEKKKKHPTIVRGLAITCTVLIFLAIISAFLILLVPQVFNSIAVFISNLGDYAKDLNALIDKFTAKDSFITKIYETITGKNDLRDQITGILKNFTGQLLNLLGNASNYVINFIKTGYVQIKNIFFGFILAMYFIGFKETLFRHLSKFSKAFFSYKTQDNIKYLLNEINVKFGKFLRGKLIDSLVVGIVTYVVLLIFKIPNSGMIAVIIAVTNIIPVFGPFIGAIPSAFIILLEDPSKVIPFVIIMIVIQQLDGNLLVPRIIGDSMGLSPVWVMVAVIVMGSLFGLVGMFFGEPIFAIIFSVIQRISNEKLARKQAAGLFSGEDELPKFTPNQQQEKSEENNDSDCNGKTSIFNKIKKQK